MMIMILMAALLLMPLDLLGEDKPQVISSDGDQTGSLQQRIDFGNAHIMGQTIKSGAVYLMHRKKSDIESMLKLRKDYRKEIMEEYGIEKTALVDNNETVDQSKAE
jgi:hypothetical protein